MFMKFFRKLQCSLTAKLNDYALGLFMLDDIEKMLPENRLEVKLIGDIKISGNRFRVAIDHDGFVSAFTGSKDAMDTGIIKFNSLSDPVWPGAQHHNFFLI